jgi:hypothetical protein
MSDAARKVYDEIAVLCAGMRGATYPGAALAARGRALVRSCTARRMVFVVQLVALAAGQAKLLV